MKPAALSLDLFVKTKRHILSSKSRIKNIPIELLPIIIPKSEDKNLFIVVPRGSFWNIYESLPFNSDRLYAIPPQDSVGRDSRFISLSERLTLQSGGVANSRGGGALVICSDCSINIPLFELTTKTFSLTSSTTRGKLVDFIEKSGYKKVDFVREVGEYAVRGGIVDIFSPGEHNPIRINFFDGVELFYFDISSQGVVGDLDSTTIQSIAKKGESTALDCFNTFLCFNYNNYTLEPLGGHNNSYTSRATVYDYSSFISNNSGDYIIFKEPSVVGFKINNINYIPEWFVGKGQQPLYKSTALESVEINDWEKGDFVVHRDFGICKYMGLSYKQGSDQELAILNFSDGVVRVSVDRFDLLSFHSKSFTKNQQLSSLNNLGPWKRTLKSTKKVAKEYVESVYNNLYRRRNVAGAVVKTSADIELEFVKSFKYKDTTGQSRAWEDVRLDLLAEWPMYRLLCGDVGFGKTEVAIRAAFVSVLSGFKVLVMAPTNILAQQLFTSFSERLVPFGVGVGFYSKSNTERQNNTTLDEFDKSTKQVIISTHKLLFIKEIYKDVGLVVIDEEHRFGVKQKEQLKDLYRAANFLLMTATPIPRTLYMSISGIKEMSVIDTAPSLRRPVITQTVPQKLDAFTPIIKHELTRGGQVFIVYNSVNTMNDFYTKVSREFNFGRVAFVHGSLSPKKISNTMNDFRNKKYDVLVASSIIESGLDIPNANTIIIYNAHRFGLAQLYQLRGRVGRDKVQSYCYLSIPTKIELEFGATQRLRTIIANSSLGSNYEISKSDLEIRGPGSLFGYRQSGGVSKIGFSLYGRFLSEAVNATRSGGHVIDSSSVKINIGTSSAIPDDYIPSHTLRTSVYNKINSLHDSKSVEKFERYLFYRFGPTPAAVRDLVWCQLLKQRSARLGIYKIAVNGQGLSFSFIKKKSQTITVITKIATSIFSIQKKVKKGDGFDLVVNVKTNTDITTKIGAFLDKLQHEKNFH